MGLLEPTHLILIGLAIMIFFGPKKIPELMRGIGKGMGELQKGVAEGKAALSNAMQEIHHDPMAETPVPEKVSVTPPIEPTVAAEPIVAAPPEAAPKKRRRPAKTSSPPL